MAKTSASRGNTGQNNSYNANGNNDRMDMDNDDRDRSFFTIVVVALMAVILLFIPILSWMYIDIKMMEIRVDKALKKIESK
jgi:uncharacterized membrane protein YdbT with pleckstrin-like domain